MTPMVAVARAPAASPRRISPRTYTPTFGARAPTTAPTTSRTVSAVMRRAGRHRVSMAPPSGIVRKAGTWAAAVTSP